MKAIQIGDWLQHANGKYYQVTRIDRLGDGNIHFACGFPHLWEYNNKFEPIPLTTEILEKNGFEEGKGGNFCRVLNIDEYKYVLYNFNDSFIYIRNEFYNMDVQIHYVHQLQHALRLCGIEKEIIL